MPGRSNFDLLVDDILAEASGVNRRREFATLGQQILAGGAIARQRNAGMLKSLNALVRESEIDARQREIDRRDHQRSHARSTFAKAMNAFDAEVAAGTMTSLEVARWEIEMQRIGAIVGQL